MPELAAHILSVPGSGIRRIHEVALRLDDVISLAVGEPDLAVAPHIAAAAKKAWDDGQTHYTANGGIPALRSAIVDKLALINGVSVETEQVWVTVGATQAVYQAMALTLSPGDEVLVPDPGYTIFTMGARMHSADPVPYPLRADDDFMPDLEVLERLVTDRTRAIIVNSPSNPLGTVLPESVQRELLAFASKHDLWVISDEVYEYFTWGEPHVSMAALDSEDRVFSVFSLSKTYAMTGIRVGYLVTPPGMADIMRTVQEASVSCVNTPAQFAAVAALTGDQQHVHVAREHYRGNLVAARQLLDERGIGYLVPRGTFYLWVDMGHAAAGDVATWAQNLLLDERVAVAPGSAFGRSGEGWIRVSVACDEQTLLEGLRRLPAP